MKTRCKFVVIEVGQLGWQGMPKDAPVQERVKLHAVYGGDKDPENESFSAATPSGSLEISVSNPNVIGKFKPGALYYLDLGPVE